MVTSRSLRLSAVLTEIAAAVALILSIPLPLSWAQPSPAHATPSADRFDILLNQFAEDDLPDLPLFASGPLPSGNPTRLPPTHPSAKPHATALAIPHNDADSEIFKRLNELEKKYAELDKSHDELQKTLKRFAENGHSGSTVQVNGRIHFDLWQFPGSSPGINGFETGDNDVSPADRIGFRRLRIGVRGNVWENMVYRIELEDALGNDIEFRDAFLGFTDLPYLQTVLIGNQKRPYGLDHWNSTHFNVFLERPFIIEAFNQNNRRLGIQSWAHTEDLRWNWQYGVFNQALVQDVGNYTSDHWQAEFAGRLANTLWYDDAQQGRNYIHWAIAGTWADTDGNQLTPNYAGSGLNQARFQTRPEAFSVNRWLDTGLIPGSENYSLIGLENVINLGPWQFTGEYQHLWLNRSADSSLAFHGGYFYLAYFLTGEHIPWDRQTGQLDRMEPFQNFFLVDTPRDDVPAGWGAWQVAVRWSLGDLSDQNIQGGIGESITFGLNWYWNPWARMQFNYIYGTIHDNALNAVGGIDYGHYHILGTRFSISY